MILHEQVLFTQVRVRSEDVGGSGTVVWSEKGSDGFYSTYILTCHHVVEKAIKIEDKWDSLLKQQRKTEIVIPVLIEMFNWRGVPHGKTPLTSGAQAEVAAYSVDDDIAVLHLKLTDKPYVAKMLQPDLITKMNIGDPTFAVGCALLHDPILTQGMITHMGDIIDGRDYWMSSAQIIFGNSGGAMFTGPIDGQHYFIGIPSRVAVIGWGTAVTHMGYFSPISRIYKFLDEQVFGFLIPGSELTEEECAAKRKAKQEAARERELYGGSSRTK